MATLTTMEVFIRLIAATIAGGVIGMERESNSQPAGFRTHILVTVGSALIMIISTTKYAPGTVGNDPMRLACQVVSGIGFLGAGTILKEGANIRGLTSATGLWVSAAIGLAFGAGMYREGLIAGLISLATLTVLIRWERKMFKEKFRHRDLVKQERAAEDNDLELTVVRDLSCGLIEDVEDVLRDHRMIVAGIHIHRSDPKESDEGRLEFTIIPKDYKNRACMDDCLKKIQALPGIAEVGIRIPDWRVAN